MNQEELDCIALGMIKGIGNRMAKKIIASAGSASAAVGMSEKELTDLDGVTANVAKEIVSSRDEVRSSAESEIRWAESCHVDVITYMSTRYPARLRTCDDSPFVLYGRGDADFNVRKVISVVGTRKPTSYGRQWCTEVLSDLAARHPDLLVVSGLAYGIDVVSHMAALESNVKTVGVVAHGLDILYPSQHKDVAKRMVLQGGAVLTEFRRGTQPEAVNFVSRNRIVAGMADLTLVVESGEKGGSLITAHKAHDYGRIVAALPGSPSSEMSKGPNGLIKEHSAELVTCAEDIEQLLGWSTSLNAEHQQGSLFSLDTEMTPLQRKLFDALLTGSMTVDELSRSVSMPVNDVASLLLEMEFSGLVSSLPGNRYSVTSICR